jgi:biopolymer transport protein ExbD
MRRLAVTATFFVLLSAQYAVATDVQIKAFRSGELLVDDVPMTLVELKAKLAQVAETEGLVQYYRDDAENAATPAQMKIIEAIVEAGVVNIQFSTRPDFSDYVDEEGQSQRPKALWQSD